MNFRLAEQTDLDQLAHMRWEHWAENGTDPAKQEKDSFVADFIRQLESKLNREWFAWCAVEGETILSHVYIQRVQKGPKPSKVVDSFGYVSNVYTRPSHRNSGIGSQVMKRVKLWALGVDLEFLVLWPSGGSISFWQRIGFSVDDPLALEIRPYTF